MGSTSSVSSAILLRAISEGSDERIVDGVRHERDVTPESVLRIVRLVGMFEKLSALLEAFVEAMKQVLSEDRVSDVVKRCMIDSTELELGEVVQRSSSSGSDVTVEAAQRVI